MICIKLIAFLEQMDYNGSRPGKLYCYKGSKEDNMLNEVQDERYCIADEAIYDAFFLIL